MMMEKNCPLLVNGELNMFPQQQTCDTTAEVSETLSSIWFVLRLHNKNRSRVKKDGSAGFHSHQTVKYGHKSCGTQNKESLCW
jgi:hypothetical protein